MSKYGIKKDSKQVLINTSLAMNFNKKIKLLILLFFALIFSCAKTVDPIDKHIGLNKSEFDKALTKDFSKNNSTDKAPFEAPIPELSQLVINSPPPESVANKLISFSATDQVPLKDVLIELGRIAKIDIDLDPSITGGIIMSTQNRPLGEVIIRIAKLGKLRYSYENNVLHFERDNPYMKAYIVDYLSEGSNLWTEVQNNISAILSSGSSANNQNRNIVSTQQNQTSTTQNQNTTNNTSANSNSTQTSTQNQNNSTANSFLSQNAQQNSIISLNKTAGILSVFATQVDHQEIEKYLANVEKNSSAQVLIEAKVIEVKLSDTFQTGINWSSFAKQNSISSSNSFASGGPFSYVAGELFNTDISASISALEQFGTTRTLSSPRIHAINNQKASLNFADKLVYFQITNTQSNASNGAAQTAVVVATTSSTKQEENVGVQLDIIPSINLRTQEITLNIKPKLSVQSDWVIDPASPKDLTDADGKKVVNRVPVIQTREINTIAKVRSGNIVVIGGLMKESSVNTDKGVPFLQRIPVLGYLFKSTSKVSELVETVIFIKATIVHSGSNVDKIDRDIQEKFDTDKRKFF